jgi:hypothetical protein
MLTSLCGAAERDTRTGVLWSCNWHRQVCLHHTRSIDQPSACRELRMSRVGYCGLSRLQETTVEVASSDTGVGS